MYRAASTPLAFSAIDGTVTAYARATGDVAWSFRVPNGQLDYPHVTRLAVTDRHVVLVAIRMEETGFFASADGTSHVYCLDHATGHTLWHVPLKPGDNIAHVTATLLVDGDQVFVASGSIFCAFALETGNLLWQQRVDRKVRQGVLPVALAVPGRAEQGDAR